MAIRNLKFGGPWNPRFERNRSFYRWCEDTNAAGLRFVGYVKPLRSCSGGDYFTPDTKQAVGWFADNFQYGCYYPAVWRLPHGRFMYGIVDPDNRGAALLADEPADTEKDAQSWACSAAKAFAEDAREEDAKAQAEQQIEDAREAVAAGRKSFLAIRKEMKGMEYSGLGSAIACCKALRERLADIIRERAAAFERIEKLTNEPWTAVEY